MTGAYHAVYLASGVDSDNVTVSNSEIYRNANHGVYVLAGNEDFELVVEQGARKRQLRRRINRAARHRSDNDVWGNASWGINAIDERRGDAADWIVIEGNRVFDNSSGISGTSQVVVRDNEVWGQGIGIRWRRTALAQGNEVWGNTTGIDMGGSSANGCGA